MGNYSSLEGSIEITPAPRISDFSIEKLKTMKGVSWGWECVTVEFDKMTTFETEDDGTEVTRVRVSGARIKACGQSGHKHYTVKETLQAIADMLGRDRNYNGYFDYDDEYGQMLRFGIVQGIAREFKPTITWPDEVA